MLLGMFQILSRLFLQSTIDNNCSFCNEKQFSILDFDFLFLYFLVHCKAEQYRDDSTTKAPPSIYLVLSAYSACTHTIERNLFRTKRVLALAVSEIVVSANVKPLRGENY